MSQKSNVQTGPEPSAAPVWKSYQSPLFFRPVADLLKTLQNSQDTARSGSFRRPFGNSPVLSCNANRTSNFSKCKPVRKKRQCSLLHRPARTDYGDLIGISLKILPDRSTLFGRPVESNLGIFAQVTCAIWM